MSTSDATCVVTPDGLVHCYRYRLTTTDCGVRFIDFTFDLRVKYCLAFVKPVQPTTCLGCLVRDHVP